ncbi:MAG TPA: sugar phosphate isomerase/epimerase family protein [Candidatus Acidoferrum sp.]|nr:sugar phosphate isomerase/epimerase family protein [Candidatus Acidoferrum sp.]
MNIRDTLSRRSFLGICAAAPFFASLAVGKAAIPVGLELYSVRDDLKKDLSGTVRSVAGMGYQCVEFYAPYYQWTLDYAKQVRQELDALGVRCYSTHNDLEALKPEGIHKAVELNQAMGAKYVVLAHPGADIKDEDGWKRIAELLNQANQSLGSHGMHAGYHNHDAEWQPIGRKKPMEILAAGTEKSVMLQLDVGTCLKAGGDPVAWVEANPGRIRSMHCKDWSPEKGYKVLFGEGAAPWKKLFAAAESQGGIEFYLIEQEGSDYSAMDTAARCLAEYRKMRA